MSILFIIFILLLLFPAVYLAMQKNFLFIDNEKNNIFLIRFIFLLPGVLSIEFVCFLIGLILLIILFAILYILMLIFSFDLPNSFIRILVGSMAIPISILTTLLLKSILRKDLPTNSPFEEQYDIDDFDTYDFYLFMPNQREMDDSASYKVTGKFGSARIDVQVKDIFAKTSKMKEDLFFTTHGEFIVSAHALNIFKGNKLTGYKTKPVIDKESKRESNFYFQLIADELQPLSSQTVFNKGFFGSVLIDENKAYYDQKILTTSADFNRTVEYFGRNNRNPYRHQRLWIVTRKVRNIFISDFNRNEKEFIPVHLINNK